MEEHSQAVNSKNTRRNKLALISFLIGLASIFFIRPLGLVAMVLGVLTLRQIKTTHEKGKNFAIAGIIIGTLAILFLLLIVFSGYLVWLRNRY